MAGRRIALVLTAALKAYVNDVPGVSPTGGTGTGKYVIIETDTSFQVSRFARSYEVTMAAGVTQTGTITTDAYTITPATAEVSNYEEVEYEGFDPNTGEAREPEYYNYAKAGTFTIAGIENYELHTIDSGTAFHAADCFDEANGQTWDFDLPYALYVPADYDPDQSYALVLHIHDAGSMSSDPMLTLTEAQGPANYASDSFQQLLKDQGLGGAIVVCPAVAEFFPMDEEHPNYELRISRDNWTLSCAAPAVWELMDYLTETYSIDPDRIYGSGQSMGGMTVMEMAAQRDNYFAGVLEISCKWGNNYNKDYPFNGVAYYDAPADGTIIFDHYYVNWRNGSEGIHTTESLDMGAGDRMYDTIRHEFPLSDFGMTDEWMAELKAAGCQLTSHGSYETFDEPGTHLCLSYSRPCPQGGIETRSREWIGWRPENGKLIRDPATKTERTTKTASGL